MIAAREYVADETAMKGHVANGKPRSGRAHGAARKGPSVNCDERCPNGKSKPQLTPDPVEATREPGKKTRKRRAWQPEARDHYIYHLVKFEGHTQGEAASQPGDGLADHRPLRAVAGPCRPAGRGPARSGRTAAGAEVADV